MRHGESELNLRDAANGDPAVACDLTPAGVRQAQELGRSLCEERLDLCATSTFQRARRTADVALAGRDVPRLELPDLGDPGYGPYEGRPLDEYRAWAWAASSTDRPGDGGESRLDVVARYARAFRTLLARPESTILVVCHALPVAYLLGARDGDAPARRTTSVANATAYPFAAKELAGAIDVLEAWTAQPTW